MSDGGSSASLSIALASSFTAGSCCPGMALTLSDDILITASGTGHAFSSTGDVDQACSNAPAMSMQSSEWRWLLGER